MFAVIKTGGKQYKVSKDDVVVIEKLAADPGENVQFNDVLMLGGDEIAVGNPVIEGAAVQAEVLEQGRGAKVLNFKKRRRKHGSQRLKGHRQYITTVRVTDILANGASIVPVPVAEETASEETASEETATEEVAAEETAVEETVVEASTDETATEDTATEDTATEDTAAEENSAEGAEKPKATE